MIDVDVVEEKIDRWVGILSKAEKMASLIPDLLLKGGIAYAGGRAMGEHDADGTTNFNLMGAVAGLLGLKLATSPGLISNIAGVATLTTIGIANMNPANNDFVEPGPVGLDGVPQNFRRFQAGRTG